MHLYGKKTFKNVILQNRGWHVAECLHISSGTGGRLGQDKGVILFFHVLYINL